MDSKRSARFSTRRYSYAGRGSTTASFAAMPALLPGKIYEFKLGAGVAPRVLTTNEVASNLHDAFANLILARGHLPLTLRELMNTVETERGSTLAEFDSFVVADGGQIPWSPATDSLDRSLRFAITYGEPNQPRALMVSTSEDFDSPDIFLQVIGWDQVAGAFQFYDRRDGSWIWAGSSWDALTPPTRGNGPFDSHVNGALNMKELKLPWINWHSQAATIDAALAPDARLRGERLWQNKNKGEAFETLVARPGIVQWTEARFARCTQNGRLTRLPEFLRQVLDTTTINLRTSTVEKTQVSPGVPIAIPLTFFINADELVDGIGLDPGITALPSVDGGIYQDVLTQFEVELSDGTFHFIGDTHFVFLYPEPAFEDVLVMDKLRELGVLTDKLAAAMLMVDFCNPVFSPRRQALLRYVPADASLPAEGATSDFAATFVAAVQAGNKGARASSPEREFLDNWEVADSHWMATFGRRIAEFFAAVTPLLAQKQSFARVFELAESRRREFRKRPLAEFALTTPTTNIPKGAPLLRITENGSIQPQ